MKSKIAGKKITLTFKQAIEATDEVKRCYNLGKQAIPNSERNKVELTDPRNCGGSLFIDGCLINQRLYPNSNRWDYAIDYNGEVYFIEVHTAKTVEVSTVLRKLDWLKWWLINSAPKIKALQAKVPYYWIQSNGYHILPNSRQEKQLNQNGLKPISKLVLK